VRRCYGADPRHLRPAIGDRDLNLWERPPDNNEKLLWILSRLPDGVQLAGAFKSRKGKKMKHQTKVGLTVVQAGLFTGVLGDMLLRATPWGLNVTLFAGTIVVLLAILSRRWRSISLLTGRGRLLCGSILFFAFCFMWRDSLVLKTLDAFAILFALSILGMHLRGNRIQLAGTLEYAGAAVLAALNASFSGFEVLLRDINWRDLPHTAWLKQAPAIARGILIALPLLLIFGALFAAADLMFENILNSLHLDVDVVIGHIFLALFITWLLAGFLRGVLLGPEFTLKSNPVSSFFSAPQPLTVSSPSETASRPIKESIRPSLSRTEIAIILGSLNFLFLLFVLVQARYFFGGAGVVQSTTGLTYAEYARRGFFELVTVSVLMLPLLLVGHWFLKKDDLAAKRSFRRLSLSLITLLYIIMGSAMLRMLIYEREYGLTELRLYTSAFMGWLALVFVWFCATVLRGQRERFAWGALGAALVVMTTVHALNPDSFIVRTNLKHAAEKGRRFDACYNSSLSAEAVPDLMQALPSMRAEDRAIIAYQLLQNWSPPARADWRTWNIARWRAKRQVRQNNALLWSQVLNGAESQHSCHGSD
jgi:hypothetical protein